MFIKPKSVERPAGFTDEVMGKLEEALNRSEHRMYASERYMARGARLSAIARQRSDAGELSTDSDEGQAIQMTLNFYKAELIAEAFMAQGAAILVAVALDWCTANKAPDSLADALYQQITKLDGVPFSSTKDVSVPSICMAAIEHNASAMQIDSTDMSDERMPELLAESALQISCGLAAGPDDMLHICDDCRDEQGLEPNPIKPITEIQALSIGPEGVKQVTPEELREIYERDGEFGHGKDAKKEGKDKKKP